MSAQKKRSGKKAAGKRGRAAAKKAGRPPKTAAKLTTEKTTLGVMAAEPAAAPVETTAIRETVAPAPEAIPHTPETAETTAPVKRRPGRPPKAATAAVKPETAETTAPVKRRPGRPPKAATAALKPETAETTAPAKRRPGRPPKAAAAAVKPETAETTAPVKRRPGRPPKAATAAVKPASAVPAPRSAHTFAQGPLSAAQVHQIDAYWRASNYLTACQLYLLDDPLLKRPLTPADIKQTIVGHWGTCPGQNFIYTHLDRVIREQDLDMIYLSGPGHGGNAMVAQDWLDGSYTEVYPNITRDEEGMRRLFKRFSFPGGIPSHVAPETPGSIHEGGELGYSLAHAFGAVADNPDLIAACVVGDGEAETGPLAASWHGNKFMSPITDGAVLPILHLNGFKIANPTIFSRMSHDEVENFFLGCGWEPRFVEGSEPEEMHQKMAAALDWAVDEIHRIQKQARASGTAARPRWPMIVLRTPKGWTGPKEVDGQVLEGSWRAHQVPIAMGADVKKNLPALEAWLRSYRPEELFDENGAPVELLTSFAPKGNRRMGANPHANGGLLLRDLRVPDFRDYAVKVKAPGAVEAQDMFVLGTFVRDVMKLNMDARNFRIFAPDETASNRLQSVFEVTGRRFLDPQIDGVDEHLDPDGRVMDSMLSEHFCEGFLEGYLLTGRHGFFDSYEAFIRIVDSMFSQHAKWLKMCNELPWRHDIASLNYILASNVWQQDHNGFTHQDPGFLDHVANKKADVVRMYLPPDANCLLSCFDHCIKSRNYVNVIVASKHPRPQWLTMEQAVKHCTQGIGIWDWASNDAGHEPDVVMACCGDTPTLETLAAVSILHQELPELKIRVVNVVDLMKLQPHTEHPHGLTDGEYDTLFTRDKPIIFAYHGYPTLIHELTYRRHNKNLHVRGYKEEGTITTPFDMRVLNDIDRFDLVIDTVRRLPHLGNRGAYLIQKMNDKLVEHRQYIHDNGIDLPEVRAWKWKGL